MKLSNIFKTNALLTIILLCMTSCSVIMAAKKEGTSIEKVQSSCSRAEMLSNGPTILSSERLPTGELVEVYQFKKEKGSAARAFMHGLLDVSTLGLWEVVGTPVEVCLKDEKWYTVKIYYDCEDFVRRIELL